MFLMIRSRPSVFVLGGLLVFSILVNILWHSYTGFIRDDAFITFRFASNLSAGQGFTYNPGEHVYGTSSPGLVMIMAAWLTFSNNPVIGSLILDSTATVLSLVLVWYILADLRLTGLQRALVLFVLIWSDKLLLHFMEGMETPLVVTCMLSSLYFMIRSRPIAAGIASGLMLWFRLDSALWVPILAVVFLISYQRYTFKDIFIFLLITGLVYLPWTIYAGHTFGTIVPQTAIAKQVAYGLGMQPWYQRAMFLFWFTPFTFLIDPSITRPIAALTIGIALFGTWTFRRSAWVRVLVLFFILESAALVALNMTGEQRYYVTSFYVLLIMFGLGLVAMFSRVPKPGQAVIIGIYAALAFVCALPRAQHLRDYQLYVYDGSLKQMGIWLREHSAPDAVVLLEPLGYVGYYSERFMLDEVGLATPVVTALKRTGLDSFIIAHYLHPDYIILHCDDAKRAPAGYPYLMAVRFDPLGFEDGQAWPDNGVQRNACYQINQK
jgi:hypothetical protein